MKPTLPEVRPLVREIYERSSVGCCLHVVLDDGNVRDQDIEFCIAVAVEAGHPTCEDVARKLLLMSRTQRLRVGR